MTDRELLELAAKAAGINTVWNIEVNQPYFDPRPESLIAKLWWNPLADDGDALRLAVMLHMALTFTVHGDAHAEGTREEYAFQEGQDPAANARRAIVRAAAEIALATKETT